MIKLTKVGVNPNSKVIQSESVDEYRIDQERGTWKQFFEGKSPPIDYWIIGKQLSELKIGQPLLIERYNRNGVIADGVMHTSKVLNVEHEEDTTYIETENSLYKSEEVDEETILNDE